MYSCNCPPGYTGIDCETLVDNCAAQLSWLNAGVCSSNASGYSCACSAGYTGKTCEVAVDRCTPNPCENGSSCANGVNAYSCNCTPGYTGPTCRALSDNCVGNPCQNGGKCSNYSGGYSCACATGYAGDNCEVDVDDCLAGSLVRMAALCASTASAALLASVSQGGRAPRARGAARVSAVLRRHRSHGCRPLRTSCSSQQAKRRSWARLPAPRATPGFLGSRLHGSRFSHLTAERWCSAWIRPMCLRSTALPSSAAPLLRIASPKRSTRRARATAPRAPRLVSCCFPSTTGSRSHTHRNFDPHDGRRATYGDTECAHRHRSAWGCACFRNTATRHRRCDGDHRNGAWRRSVGGRRATDVGCPLFERTAFHPKLVECDGGQREPCWKFSRWRTEYFSSCIANWKLRNLPRRCPCSRPRWQSR